MTTPIAYITGYLHDPFTQQNQINAAGNSAVKGARRGLFEYQSIRDSADQPGGAQLNNAYRTASRRSVNWGVKSAGPSRRVNTATIGGNFVQYLARIPDNPAGNKFTASYPSRLYDSTNGTISFGYLFRSSEGQPGS